MAQNVEGRDWSKALVKRVGRDIKAARKGRSAGWLSDRTAELGYRISPTVIAKLDSGHRGDVLTVPELLVLAAAVDLPPALLLFGSFPSGTVELLPDDREATGYAAVKWLAGDRPLPARRVDRARGISDEPVNVGTQLVAAVRERDRLSAAHMDANLVGTSGRAADKDAQKRLMDALEYQLATVNARIADLCEQLGAAEQSAAAAGGDA